MTALADMVIGHIEHRLDARADRIKMRVGAERHLHGSPAFGKYHDRAVLMTAAKDAGDDGWKTRTNENA